MVSSRGRRSDRSMPSSHIASTTCGCTRSPGVVPADRASWGPPAALANSAWLIWERPALCRQTKRTFAITTTCGPYPKAKALTNVTSISIRTSMPVDLELAPKRKRPAGEPCCEPVVYPDVEREDAQRMAAIAKALGDPVRVQLVDVLREHAGKVGVCELVRLFPLSEPTVSHHVKVLREAGLGVSEAPGMLASHHGVPHV